jgi:hypothetical protein
MRYLLCVALPGLILPVLSISQTAFAAIPLPSVPSWTSSDNDYSTGGALADVDGDGWLDFLTSNGNDMHTDQNSVYMNNGGTLETAASWRSSDAGYFGHCYTGDVDNDGDDDLAASYLGRLGSGELTARIYRNEGGALETSPSWKAHDQHSSFDCCLGDVDLDGDLDLAISAGDAYRNETDSVRIYRNNGGTFDTLPFWTAHNGYCSDAVRFGDIDNDGDLELFVGQVVPNEDRGFVSMYRNNAGTLETTPSWVARPGVGWVLRLALGDYDGDSLLDLAVASNNQTGEPNSIKVYRNNGGTLDTTASFTMLRTKRYSSCVAWGDVNGDGYPDLAAGGWWEPIVVFENHSGLLDTTPTWAWSPSPQDTLVSETVAWSDLTNGHLSSAADSCDGDGQRKLFNLHRRPVQLLDSVCVDGVRVPVAGFCSDALVGWVSFASAPPAGTANVVFFYRYSMAPDLAVTNWSPSRGNRVFQNATSGGIAASLRPEARVSLRARPNPAAGGVTITLTGVRATAEQSLRILDMAGREVRVLNRNGDRWSWDGSDNDGRPVATGIYLAECGEARLKLVRLARN